MIALRASRMASCLLLTALAASGSNPVRAAEHVTETELLKSIAAVRQSMQIWDAEEMVQAAQELAILETVDAKEVFYRDYWRATALFHAILALREEANKQATTLRKSLNKPAVQSLQTVLNHDPNNSDGHAMLAVLYGMSISQHPLQALRLGPGVLRHRKAAALGRATNPRVSYLEGVALLDRTKDAQDIEKALRILLEAETLFNQEATVSRAPWEPDWGHEHNRMFIGEAYEKLGQWAKAMEWFEQASGVAPNLTRAAEGYKRCRKRMANESL
jgi:tetratricopeptide (TPR) repeat protein